MKMERSGFSDRTNCIQEPVSAESISSPSTISFPRSLCPLLFVSPPSFFSILSYDPTGVTIGEVLPAVCFPSVCECSLLQHPGSCEPTLEHLRTHCSLVEKEKAFLATKPTTECSISPCPCNYCCARWAHMQFIIDIIE